MSDGMMLLSMESESGVQGAGRVAPHIVLKHKTKKLVPHPPHHHPPPATTHNCTKQALHTDPDALLSPITSAVIVALLHHNVHPLPFLSSPSCSHRANAVMQIRSPDNSGHVQVAQNLPADCKGENAAVHVEDSNPRSEKGGSSIGIVWGRGRHDPCLLSPAVPMVEAMESCLQMRHRWRPGRSNGNNFM
eukprot:scaffold9591_cov54-Cyclotella_meneghiniana.AAC.3